MAVSSQQTQSVLSEEKWHALFPKELYQKATDKNSSISASEKRPVRMHSLKYLIVLGYSDENLFKLIQNLKSKNSHQINSPFPLHQFTALHIAVMRNRPRVVKELIEARANVEAQDEFGWTPLHHAALITDDLTSLLLKKGASWKKTTPLGGTWQDLMCLVRRKKAGPQAVLFYRGINDDQPLKIEEQNLSQRLGINYIDEYFWPQEHLNGFWTSTDRKEVGRHIIQSQIKDQVYPLFKKSCPRIILEEQRTHGSPLTSIGAVAGEDFESYRLIGEYTGEITMVDPNPDAESCQENTYSFTLEESESCIISVDAQAHGNWTRYINDGFPNLFSFDLYNTMGQRVRKIFFVADPNGVKKNEQFLYDYSGEYYYLKWGNYQLLGKEKMRAFFKDFQNHVKSYFQLQSKVSGHHFDYSDAIKLGALQARLLYILQTPLALMDLVFSQTINHSELMAQIKKDKNTSHSPFSEKIFKLNPYYSKIYDLLNNLGQFDEWVSTLSRTSEGKDLVEKTRGFFLENRGNVTVEDLHDKLRALNDFVYRLNSTEYSPIHQIDEKLSELFC